MTEPQKEENPESIPAAFVIRDRYLEDYYDGVLIHYKRCGLQKLQGHSFKAIEQGKHFRKWMASMMDIGEKLRPKLIKKNSKTTHPYTLLLDSLTKMQGGETIDYATAMKCTREFTDFFEDAGFTKIDRITMSPDRAVDEWA